MPTEDLFGSYNERRLPLKSIFIGLAALAVLVGAAYGLYRYTKPEPISAEELLAIDVRETTVLLLDYRTFSGAEFHRQVLGRGRLERYKRSIDEALFTYPQSSADEFSGYLAKYFWDPAKVEMGKEKNGEIWLGDYHAPPSDELGYIFRTGISNIRFDPHQTLDFKFNEVSYSPTLAELHGLTTNSQVYGGRMLTQVPERSFKPTMVFANHGIMVAKPGEPSLKRLADDILKNTPASREARIQKLVDFVSTEIEYSYSEAMSRGETLKRGDETLMTRSGDCSNKTILLASLLEQIGEPYLLLYCPRHITVAVPQGDFPDENKLDLKWNDRRWLIAETTLAGFQVGRTKVNEARLLTHVEYVQDPKNADVIFDANSYEVLKFL